MMRFRDRVRRTVDQTLPTWVAYRKDLLRPMRLYGGPMNGQPGRQQLVRDILREIAFDEVVETGTYRGVTTTFLSDVSGLPVHSAETAERFFRYAQVRCADRPGIALHHGDSRGLLRRLAEREGDAALFCYLDAHWGEDVPRYEELLTIHQRWSRAVVIIDDFRVHDDPGYGHETYHGRPLDLDYLPELPGWQMFFPALSAAEEGGCKRGCLVLASAELAAAVEALPGVRPVPPREAAGAVSTPGQRAARAPEPASPRLP
ncbi:class I SAM-dependent methyltransferase [Streptomyces sp. A7024]|uniref:Class I SAM-dependent methyltransferase n=1 Tax=Streptomyces coryli TaxID=1128680 RepID=A0A6G4U1D1_9ACTN|nr:class I SAM-dependent methyltransferase [Streptomyces coryli]NGN65087.1 class I SAM-dependent methyltransferase [Streptomyces coryli]